MDRLIKLLDRWYVNVVRTKEPSLPSPIYYELIDTTKKPGYQRQLFDTEEGRDNHIHNLAIVRRREEFQSHNFSRTWIKFGVKK